MKKLFFIAFSCVLLLFPISTNPNVRASNLAHTSSEFFTLSIVDSASYAYADETFLVQARLNGQQEPNDKIEIRPSQTDYLTVDQDHSWISENPYEWRFIIKRTGETKLYFTLSLFREQVVKSFTKEITITILEKIDTITLEASDLTPSVGQSTTLTAIVNDRRDYQGNLIWYENGTIIQNSTQSLLITPQVKGNTLYWVTNGEDVSAIKASLIIRTGALRVTNASFIILPIGIILLSLALVVIIAQKVNTKFLVNIQKKLVKLKDKIGLLGATTEINDKTLTLIKQVYFMIFEISELCANATADESHDLEVIDEPLKKVKAVLEACYRLGNNCPIKRLTAVAPYAQFQLRYVEDYLNRLMESERIERTELEKSRRESIAKERKIKPFKRHASPNKKEYEDILNKFDKK